MRWGIPTEIRCSCGQDTGREKINHFNACCLGLLPLIQATACCVLSVTSAARGCWPCNHSSLQGLEQKSQGAGSSSRGQATALAGYCCGDRHARFGSLLPDPGVTQDKPPCAATVPRGDGGRGPRGVLGGRFPCFCRGKLGGLRSPCRDGAGRAPSWAQGGRTT